MSETNLYTLEEVGNGRKPYREVKALERKELLEVERGKYNKILLRPESKRVLERFLEFSEKFESLPLAVKEFERERLESKLESVRERKEELESEVSTLKNKLVLVRKPWYKRALVRVRDLLERYI